MASARVSWIVEEIVMLIPDLVLRHTATDRRSLNLYLDGVLPLSSEIVRNQIYAERSYNYALPDHYYNNIANKAYAGCTSVREILIAALHLLICDKMEWRGDYLYIKSAAFSAWHDLITQFPPVPLLAAAILERHGPPGETISQHISYIDSFMKPNLGITALASPYHAALNDIVKYPGLYDLHQHLNGSSEADQVWLSALNKPHKYYLDIREGWDRQNVRELYLQFDQKLTPYVFLYRLQVAVWLRIRMIEEIFEGKQIGRRELEETLSFVQMPFSRRSKIIRVDSHPIKYYLNLELEDGNMQYEGYFHALAQTYLKKNRSLEVFAYAYHVYMLLHGAFCQLIVHQHDQYGFEQFQSISDNDIRKEVERDYSDMFTQVAGKKETAPVMIEGRFAPDVRHSAIKTKVKRIISGYAKHCGYHCFDYDNCPLPKRFPEIKLVTHFIKKPETISGAGFLVRHHHLRNQLEDQAKALLASRSSDTKLKQLLVGIDAASNELHAPPEVFSPIYRKLRKNGFANFTFHVGEDFVHLLTGIRRIWEAVEFLDLQSGNRLGHATAIGIHPKHWLNAVHSSVVMARQEWLDNLIFAYDLLRENAEGQSYLERIQAEIDQLSRAIYGKYHSVLDHIAAWKMRGIDPLLASYGGGTAGSIYYEDIIEWNNINEKRKQNPIAYNIYMEYQHNQKQGYELIVVDDRLADSNLMLLLQRKVLSILHKKEIAIETMLTSNVRISYYRTHKEHHIWRWLEMAGHEKPTLCVASDDPGIFATNLYNEYAHIFQGLLSHQGKSLEEATRTIRELAENSRRYCFK